MIMKNPTRILWKTAGLLTAMALVAGSFLVLPAAPAYADEGTPPNPERGKERGERLERFFEREQDWLERQAGNLGKADAVADRLGELIEKAKANGVDTGDLEAALASFESAIGGAKRSHEKAAAIIAAHAGFNGGGKVTDPEQAIETVKSAGAALRQAAGTMKDAGQALREAVRAWREAHPRPQPGEGTGGA
jgi:hypothetical protein